MAKEFYIKPGYAGKPLITQIDGELINLAGEKIEQEVLESPGRPAHTITIKGATQRDLAKISMGSDEYGDFSRIIGERDAPANSKAKKLPSVD